MLSDTSISIAELLECADFHTLLIYHTLERRNNDHRSHGKSQDREDKREPVEHLCITARRRDVAVRPGCNNQRSRYCLLYGSLNGTLVSTFLQLYENSGVRQVRHSTVIQQNKAVMLRIRNSFFGCYRIFSGKNRTSHGKAEALPGDQKRNRISRLQIMSNGKLLLHQATACIPFLKQSAGTEIRSVDVHRPFIDFKGCFNIFSQSFHIHSYRGTRQDILDTAGVPDCRKILPGKACSIHPEICQITGTKIGFYIIVNQPPAAIEPGKNPGAEETQQNHGNDLHSVPF